MDNGEQRERERGPHRPEVAVGRDRPDRNQEAEQDDGDAELNRERLAPAHETDGCGLLEHKHDGAGDADSEGE